MINLNSYEYFPNNQKEEVIFPIFKFLNKIHANNLLTKGEIFISNQHSFRDRTLHDGLILDEQEGLLNISIKKFRGLGRDFPRTPNPFIGSGDTVVNLTNVTFNDTSLPDAYIYCCTSLFFSDTLLWALREGKTSCIIILDSNKFAKKLMPHFENHTYLSNDDQSFFSCNYIGHDFNFNELNFNELQNHLRDGYFSKRAHYREQREARFIIIPNNRDEELEPQLLTLTSFDSLFIEIDIRGIDPSIIKGKSEGKIISKIYKKSDDNPAIFEIEKPFGVYSPAVIAGHIGFMYVGKTISFEGLKVSNADGAIVGKNFFCSVELSDVLKIEICTIAL